MKRKISIVILDVIALLFVLATGLAPNLLAAQDELSDGGYPSWLRFDINAFIFGTSADGVTELDTDGLSMQLKTVGPAGKGLRIFRGPDFRTEINGESQFQKTGLFISVDLILDFDHLLAKRPELRDAIHHLNNHIDQSEAKALDQLERSFQTALDDGWKQAYPIFRREIGRVLAQFEDNWKHMTAEQRERAIDQFLTTADGETARRQAEAALRERVREAFEKRGATRERIKGEIAGARKAHARDRVMRADYMAIEGLLRKAAVRLAYDTGNVIFAVDSGILVAHAGFADDSGRPLVEKDIPFLSLLHRELTSSVPGISAELSAKILNTKLTVTGYAFQSRIPLAGTRHRIAEIQRYDQEKFDQYKNEQFLFSRKDLFTFNSYMVRLMFETRMADTYFALGQFEGKDTFQIGLFLRLFNGNEIHFDYLARGFYFTDGGYQIVIVQNIIGERVRGYFALISKEDHRNPVESDEWQGAEQSWQTGLSISPFGRENSVGNFTLKAGVGPKRLIFPRSIAELEVFFAGTVGVKLDPWFRPWLSTDDTRRREKEYRKRYVTDPEKLPKQAKD